MGNNDSEGFEPLRVEPNGFRVHLLNHSDTLSRSLMNSHPHQDSILNRVQRALGKVPTAFDSQESAEADGVLGAKPGL